MSLIAGIFVGHITRTQGSLGYPPLDESHNPFKRSDERPGGPKRGGRALCAGGGRGADR